MNCLGKNQSHEKLSTICAKSKEVLTSNRKSLETCMNISFIHKATVFHSKLEAQLELSLCHAVHDGHGEETNFGQSGVPYCGGALLGGQVLLLQHFPLFDLKEPSHLRQGGCFYNYYTQ